MRIECDVRASTLREGDLVLAVNGIRLPETWVRAEPTVHSQRWEPRPDHMTKAGMATNCQVLLRTIKVPYRRARPSSLDLNLYLEDHEPVTIVANEDDDLAAEVMILADRLRSAHLNVTITRMGAMFATASSAFTDCVIYVQPFAVAGQPRGVYVETFYGESTDPMIHGGRRFGAIKGKVTRTMRRYRSANANAQAPLVVSQGIWGKAWCEPIPQPEPCHVHNCVYRQGHDLALFPHRAPWGNVLTPQVPVV